MELTMMVDNGQCDYGFIDYVAQENGIYIYYTFPL